MDVQTQSSSLPQDPIRSVTVGGNKATCQCGEGYTCVITRSSGPDAGKTYTCSGNCSCVLDVNDDGSSNVQQKTESHGVSSAYCECGEGWSCVITKTEGPDAGKAAFECAGGCTCVTTA